MRERSLPCRSISIIGIEIGGDWQGELENCNCILALAHGVQQVASRQLVILSGALVINMSRTSFSLDNPIVYVTKCACLARGEQYGLLLGEDKQTALMHISLVAFWAC
jgi:hypothetical protein